ncbi:hypothetical protein V6N13_114641 [Hibiscus sabdariffa]
MVLSDLKSIAEKNLNTIMVIGIPVYFTDLQRRAVLDAAHLIHEPTATALAYGIYKITCNCIGILVEFHNLRLNQEYSRMAIFEQRVDNIVGIAYAMDLLDYVPRLRQFLLGFFLFYHRNSWLIKLCYNILVFDFEGPTSRKYNCGNYASQTHIHCALH